MSDSKKDKDAEAKKRSDAARKAAATRKRNEKAEEEATAEASGAAEEGVAAVTARDHASEPQGDESDPETMSRRPEPVPPQAPRMHDVPRRRLARDEAQVKAAKKG